MMSPSLPTGLRGRVLAIALTVVVAASVWLAVAAPLISWHADRAEWLHSRRMLAVRMQQLADELSALRRSAAAIQSGPGAAFVGGGNDAIAAAKLQDVVQKMADAAGVTLSSVAILPPEPAGAFRRIGLRVSIGVARWPAVVSLLQGVEQATPPLMVDELELHAMPAREKNAGPSVGATFALYGFAGHAPTPVIR
jgi:general secretion pathway protein M